MAIRNFMDLIVWNKSHQLTLDIYKVTKHFPKSELFGLISQIRRSSASVGANIVEGHKKPTKEFARFLQIAQGSLEETQYHLLLSKDLGYVSNHMYLKFKSQTDEIGKMLSGLRSKLA